MSIQKSLIKENYTMPKDFGVSPITNTIYYGTQDPKKNVWTGKKEDVTEEAIKAVFMWFMGNMEGNEEYGITFPNTGYTLTMHKSEESTDSDEE